MNNPEEASPMLSATTTARRNINAVAAWMLILGVPATVIGWASEIPEPNQQWTVMASLLHPLHFFRFGGPLFVAGAIGLFSRTPRGYWLGVIALLPALALFPIGTIIAVAGLLTLRDKEGRSLFAASTPETSSTSVVPAEVTDSQGSVAVGGSPSVSQNNRLASQLGVDNLSPVEHIADSSALRQPTLLQPTPSRLNSSFSPKPPDSNGLSVVSVWLVVSGFGVLIGGLPRAGDFVVAVLLLTCAYIVAAWGIAQRARWGLYLARALLVPTWFAFPIGTIFGVYCSFVLARSSNRQAFSRSARVER
jgi:hypothetical protein